MRSATSKNLELPCRGFRPRRCTICHVAGRCPRHRLPEKTVSAQLPPRKSSYLAAASGLAICRLIAQMKAESSRATAVTATGAGQQRIIRRSHRRVGRGEFVPPKPKAEPTAKKRAASRRSFQGIIARSRIPGLDRRWDRVRHRYVEADREVTHHYPSLVGGWTVRAWRIASRGGARGKSLKNFAQRPSFARRTRIREE